MIVLTNGTDNVARYAFNDSTLINVEVDHVKVGNPLELVIGDMMRSKCTVHTAVDNVPEDYEGCKYNFDGTNWTANPDWTAPLTQEELDALDELNSTE